MHIRLYPLDHWDYFCFLFFLGHQSVRDRTAQAGTPNIKMHGIYTMEIFIHCVHVNNRINFQKTDGVLVAMEQLAQ